MDVTVDNIRAFSGVLRSEFQAGFSAVEPQWGKFASLVNSTKSGESYSWLGDFPMFREWIGDRRITGLREKVYRLLNRDFECTVAIKKNRFDDDELGTYGSLTNGYGKAAAENPDVLCFDALKAGFKTECYDGQNFFDDEHPVGEGAAMTTVSNFAEAGAGGLVFWSPPRR